MGSKASFIVGAGIGYVLGTRAGRQRFDTIASVSRRVWRSPVVQSRVTELEAKAADMARTEAAAIKGRVSENLRSAVRSGRTGVSGAPVERYPAAPSGGSTNAGGTSVAPGAPFTTPPGSSSGGTGAA